MVFSLILKRGPFEEGEVSVSLSVFEGVVACDESCCAFVDLFNFMYVGLCVGVPYA